MPVMGLQCRPSLESRPSPAFNSEQLYLKYAHNYELQEYYELLTGNENHLFLEFSHSFRFPRLHIIKARRGQ